MLDHSSEYHIAFVVATLETFLLPRWMDLVIRRDLRLCAGFSIATAGLLCRWTAMMTTKQHFTHHIAESKRESHALITTGIYSYVRHPSYLGFTLFSLGAQLFLGNAVSLIVFYLALHRFFSERIPYEEATLCRFFGKEWDDYKTAVRFAGML